MWSTKFGRRGLNYIKYKVKRGFAIASKPLGIMVGIASVLLLFTLIHTDIMSLSLSKYGASAEPVPNTRKIDPKTPLKTASAVGPKVPGGPVRILDAEEQMMGANANMPAVVPADIDPNAQRVPVGRNNGRATEDTSDYKYKAEWDSLDSRPMPKWYPDAKLGIFIHWGLSSVPSMGATAEQFWGNWKSEGELDKQIEKRKYMTENYAPKFKFQDFAPQFKAELFNPDDWVNIFEASGAKYVVLTAKHHDGYMMWPSKQSFNWNAKDTGPGRDIVGELKAALDKSSLRFGVYVSLLEWFHPKYLADMKEKFRTTTFVDEKLYPELIEMVERYHPQVIFADGDWLPSDYRYWRSPEFLSWLFSKSPVKETVVVNDRWGMRDCWCKHGSYYTCGDKSHFDKKQNFVWESAMTIDVTSWGYRRDSKLDRYLTVEKLLAIFIKTISCGGNMLMNIGPTSHGTIAPIYEERLRQMGKWLRVNKEAVYASRPWEFSQNDTTTPGIWYTHKPGATFAFLQTWPEDELVLGAPVPTADTKITLLGYRGPTFEWKRNTMGEGIVVQIPPIHITKMPCLWAWVLRLEYLEN